MQSSSSCTSSSFFLFAIFFCLAMAARAETGSAITGTDPFVSGYSRKASMAADPNPWDYSARKQREATGWDSSYYSLRRSIARDLRLCYETYPLPGCYEGTNKCNRECQRKFQQRAIFGSCRSSNLCSCEMRC